MHSVWRISLLLFFAALSPGFPAAFSAPESGACQSGYAALSGAHTSAHAAAQAAAIAAEPATAKFVPFRVLRGRPEAEVRQFFRAVSRRQVKLRATAQRLSESSLRDMERYYLDIKRQVGEEGYVRALSVEEAANIFADGGMGSGYDFAFRNEGARVGHGGNFIFVVCRKCPPSRFTGGSLGSSVVNLDSIPLDELELVVPQVPPWAVQ